MVLVDDLLHDGETEAGAARLRGDVGLENAGHQLRWKAAPLSDTASRTRSPSSVRTSMEGAAPRAWVLERVLRVLHQIVDHLPDLRAVGPDRGQALGKMFRDRHTGILVQSEHLAHQRVQVERRGLRRRQARVVPEIVHHRLERRHLMDDCFGGPPQDVCILAR